MIFTVKKISFADYISVVVSIFLLGLIVSAPEVCAEGAKAGLKICADILVPSLFPFAVPVFFLIETDLFKNSKHIVLLVMVLSMLGGYPVGAKLISELNRRSVLDDKLSRKMVPFCVNAGPAFVVIAIGKGILKSTLLGHILLLSHIAAAIISALIFLPKPKSCCKTEKSPIKKSFSDNFVLSIQGASSACISICAYVVFFSVINAYIGLFSSAVKPVGYFLYFTEVTSALKNTGNIYFISFLLGFAGLSIWMQVFSLTSKIKPNIIEFILVRILHGALSAAITFLLIRTLKISIITVSNGIEAYKNNLYSDLSLSLSLLTMAILLAINISSKKHSGNIIKDVI